MIQTFALDLRKGSLLARYTQRLGTLVDRRLSQIALEGARKRGRTGTPAHARRVAHKPAGIGRHCRRNLHIPQYSIVNLLILRVFCQGFGSCF